MVPERALVKRIWTMRAPHFIQLSRIDELRFITACRHGLVHMTWGRATLRFSRDEFRLLVKLVGRAAGDRLPSTAREGALRVTCRADEDCELRVGPLVLLLSPADFQAFLGASKEAVQRLDEILESGMWDKPAEDNAPPGILEQFQRFSFSQN
jgi:hypothetical protein